MSANKAQRIDFPPQLWLQPVSFDPDAYRQFAQSLDEGLAQLVTNHRTRRTRYARPIMFLFGPDEAADPTEDVLPDQDIW